MRRVWEPMFMGRQLLLWLVLGSLTGAVVGLIVTYFLKLLFWSMALTAFWPLWLVVVALLVAGLATGLLIHYRAVPRQSGRINWKVAPIKALDTITTIAPGGAAGKEGPSPKSALPWLQLWLISFDFPQINVDAS